MTEETDDQVIGKLVRERRSAQIRLDTLRRAGKDQGTRLREISEYLDANIQRVWFQRGTENAPPLDQIIRVKMSDVSGEGLADLTDEIRATQAELDRLNEECKGAGY
ncbi:MAG: hypothetical protein WBE38_07700 [Terracidiphilus sp.]